MGSESYPLVPTGGGGSGDALTTDPLSQFAATTSAQLRSVVSDANTLLLGYATTATAAGTTTLTATSANTQLFTGVTTQTVVMPVTSTLSLGFSFRLTNLSTGALTINSSGGNLIATIPANMSLFVVCILTSGTAAASWAAGFEGFGSVTGTGAVVLSNSPTLVSPALGTPSALVLTNATGLPFAGIVGLGTKVKLVDTVVAAKISGTTTTPYDDTIPQISEGVEFFATASLTPTSAASSYIFLISQLLVSSAAAVRIATTHLHRDADANALKSNQGSITSTAGESANSSCIFKVDATDGVARTYSVRCGLNGAATIQNYNTTPDDLGATLQNIMLVFEVFT